MLPMPAAVDADCEERDDWFLEQDVNAWSSVAYVAVGALIVAIVVRGATRARRPGRAGDARGRRQLPLPRRSGTLGQYLHDVPLLGLLGRSSPVGMPAESAAGPELPSAHCRRGGWSDRRGHRSCVRRHHRAGGSRRGGRRRNRARRPPPRLATSLERRPHPARRPRRRDLVGRDRRQRTLRRAVVAAAPRCLAPDLRAAPAGMVRQRHDRGAAGAGAPGVPPPPIACWASSPRHSPRRSTDRSRSPAASASRPIGRCSWSPTTATVSSIRSSWPRSSAASPGSLPRRRSGR